MTEPKISLPLDGVGGHRHPEPDPSVMAESYLRMVFKGVASGFIHLWIKGESGKRSLFFDCGEAKKAAEEAVSLALTNDVYLGMCLRKEDLGPNKRGSAEDICAVTCLWLDVDISGPAHKESNLPPDEATVLRILSELPPFSLFVRSGHGCYPIWLLDKPLILENKKDRDFAKGLLKRFHRAAGKLFKREGFSLDNVGDLARILRLPATMNHKLEPVPVTFEGTGQRYSLDALESAVQGIIGETDKINSASDEPSHQSEVHGNGYSADLIAARCLFIEHCVKDAQTLPEPEWFAMITVLAATRNGRELIHRYSQAYPGYSFNETEGKIEQVLAYGRPFSCRTITEKCGDKYCEKCKFRELLSSPLILGTMTARDPNEGLSFPIQSLPEQLRQYVVEGAEAICCPVDFIAVPILVCAGGIIGDTCHIAVKPGWMEHAGLYAVFSCPPSSKKSPALKAASKFTKEFAAILEGEYQDDMLTYYEEMAQYEKNLGDWKDGKITEKPWKPSEPKRKRLYTVEATVESLGPMMKENPQGIILIMDELSSWTRGMNAYKGGNGADRQAYLSFYSAADYTIDRKGREPIMLPRTFLGVVGGIQPDILPELAGDRGRDGFIERLLISSPTPVRQRWNDKIISKDAEDTARGCFEDLFRIRNCMVDPAEPRLIELGPEAHGIFVPWHDACFQDIEENNLPPVLAGMWGKMPGQVARIALILHCCREPNAIRVSGDTMRMAIQLGEYFKANAKKVFASLDGAGQSKAQGSILNWMFRHDKQHVSIRELVTAGVKGCGNTKATQAILDEMVSQAVGIWSDIKPSIFIKL